GIARMQFRVHDVGAARREALLSKVAARCNSAGVELLVNGDATLARAFGCGLHLRAAQLHALRERPLAAGFAVAASCHDAGELQRAQALGCDFAVVGPVTPTPTHPGIAGLGWERFALLREQVSLPIYAIGGVTPGDIAQA